MGTQLPPPRDRWPFWHRNNRARTQGAARYSYSYTNRLDRNDIIFDHDRPDVYRLSMDYVAQSFVLAKDLSGLHRHARDQWLRAAQSIPFNIAEGNGKRSLKHRNRFFDIARGSALECASVQGVLAVCDGIDGESHRYGKQQRKRIVLMLTKLIARPENVAAPATQYHADVDYEYEYRFAEYEYRFAEYEYRFAEYEYEGGAEPEPALGG